MQMSSIARRVVSVRPLWWLKRVLVDWAGLSLCGCGSLGPDTAGHCQYCPDSPPSFASELAERIRAHRHALWTEKYPDHQGPWTAQMRQEHRALMGAPVRLRLGRLEVARLNDEVEVVQALQWLDDHAPYSVVLMDARSHLEVVLDPTAPAAPRRDQPLTRTARVQAAEGDEPLDENPLSSGTPAAGEQDACSST